MIKPCGKRPPCTEYCEAEYDLSPAGHPSPAPHSHSGCSGDVQKVVHFLDLPGGLLAEAAYRSSQCKDPNGRTNRHMVVPHQINAHRFNGHCPAVHPIASAPPEAQGSFCALRGANFIERGTCPIRFFHRLLFYIAHP